MLLKNNWLAVFVVSIFILFFFVGGFSQKKTIDVDVKFLYRIGDQNSDSPLDNNSDIFAKIMSIATDKYSNLYVLDKGLMQIKKYDAEGNRLKVINLNKGQGPGEFTNPKHIALDEAENIFVICQNNRTITKLDSEGNYVGDLKLTYLPTQFVVVKDKLYITRFWISGTGLIIKRYSLDLKFEYEFMEQPNNAHLIAMTGNFERMQKFNGSLLYSFPFPYRIVEFDPNGNIVREASGQKKFTKLPDQQKMKLNDPRIKNEVFFKMREGSRGLAVLPEGHVLNIVMSDSDYYIDIFSPSLLFLKRINVSAFGLESFRNIVADSKGDIYLDKIEPIPCIIKYKIKIHSED